MLVEQRHEKILELLESKNSLKVEELRQYFSVSESTLRNDLRYLEEKNLLRRAHGGAIKLQKVNEVSFQQRSLNNQSEKRKIGMAAAQYINPEETIFLDAGTTVMELALHLPEDYEFNVVTSALNTAMAAAEHANISVHLVGGLLRPKLQELVGPKAVTDISEISAQTLFLGASGLSFDRGVTENHIFSAEVKKAMIQSSEKVILLLDSSKMGKSFFVDLLPIEKIDVLITDQNISAEYQTKLTDMGIELVIV